MTEWHLWVIAGLLLTVAEIKLSGFVTLWFGVGAFIAGLFAAVGLGLSLQLAAFTAVSVTLFVLSRTIFQRFFVQRGVTHKQGNEAMLGTEAQVIESLPGAGYGTVRVNGELWAARSLTGPVADGTWVRIEQVDGLKLIVRPETAATPVSLSRKENP